MQSSIFLLALLVLLAVAAEARPQLPAGWSATGQTSLQQAPAAFVPQLHRQPINADLQNQVSALSAQLAAANRQLEYFQQQLALREQQAPQQPAGQPTFQQPIQSLQQALQAQQQQPQQVSPFQHFQAQQQLLALQQQQQQPQPEAEQPRVSTLVDESDLSSTDFRSPPAPSTTASPPASIEPSFVQAQPAQPAGSGPVHKTAKNDDKFSIGLGVLSPGYTQKFGNTALDFNQDKNGFSFTLSNNGHNNQVPQIPKAAAESG